MSLRIVPVDLKTAREFVAVHHRHNDPPIGHKFSLGVADGNQLVGVAIVGRPVSRVIQSEGYTLEVIRTATDGTRKHLLGKAKTYPRNPQMYVTRSISLSPFEVQQFIDENALPACEHASGSRATPSPPGRVSPTSGNPCSFASPKAARPTEQARPSATC